MAKDQRLNIRVSPEQHGMLRRAAELAGQTISDYVLSRVLADAQDELIDRRVFALDAAAWTEMQHRVERPGEPRPELGRLLREQAPWQESAVPAEHLALDAETVRDVIRRARENFRRAYHQFVEEAEGDEGDIPLRVIVAADDEHPFIAFEVPAEPTSAA